MICFPSIVGLCKMGPKDIWSISEQYRPSFNSKFPFKNLTSLKKYQCLWPGVGRQFGWDTKAEGLAGLLAIRQGSGMPAIMFCC